MRVTRTRHPHLRESSGRSRICLALAGPLLREGFPLPEDQVNSLALLLRGGVEAYDVRTYIPA
ncbi:hypothetical protein SSTG_01062 [Streptomyces sp. e14]|nr:hypothetical protein SSTG_01062 [Streptomyces sp. e14]